jgi:hypothetical protein
MTSVAAVEVKYESTIYTGGYKFVIMQIGLCIII